MSSVKRKKKLNSLADNDDLLTEILIRLPLKSLLICKSVSKRWHSLISSPHFCRCLYPDAYLVSGLLLHRSSILRNPEHDFVPLSDKSTSPPFKTLTFVNHPSGLKILQSCHGLLFCSSFRDQGPMHDYFIYNPTTKQFLTLPRPGGQISTIVCGITLAFDPDKSPHYKVVCVRKLKSSQGYLGIYSRLENAYPFEHHYLGNYLWYQIEIYSSETRSWRLSVKSFIAQHSVNFRRGVFWNGAVHWVNCFGPSLYFKVDDDEKLRKMPMPATPIPDGWEDGRRLRYFDESREHLHLVEIYGPCTAKFDVYEMETDYSGWFVKYRVDLNIITIAFPEIITAYLDPTDLHYYKFAILGIIREANDEESYMVLHLPGKAICYNLNNKTFNKICDFSPGHEDIHDICYPGYLKFSWFDSFHYIETLASI
ncbi:hypothetical protein Dsin_015112 [Dipteronia sinensis]|uniref:F-box domain-containing protein n=1 Tax=Dipteronia sinensis TaxID=43782 RepID=A0AAE0APE1_9ROSI|nr:hypothetical protein Dsin_015112 [Dipteronia sinensis]